MSYPYEDLDDSQFEHLVVQCARKLFGRGVQSFAAGPDGGRDARFEGTAQQFPSARDPWTGVTVLQAKHTIAVNAHYSDADFNGESENAVLNKEIPRIKRLVDDGELDNYVLFTNRRLGGVIAPRIMDRIAEDSGMDRSRIFLVGVEYLDDLLHEFPELPSLARIDPVDGPLIVSSFDLAEMMLAIAEELSAPLPPFDASVVDRVSYVEKNELNNMSDPFAKTLADRYLVYTREIERFLASPANAASLRYYEAAAEEFQLKVIAKRHEFQNFDSVFNHLVDILVKRDGVLARNRKLLRAVLFYMYWHCDIGETVDADAQ